MTIYINYKHYLHLKNVIATKQAELAATRKSATKQRTDLLSHINPAIKTVRAYEAYEAEYLAFMAAN
jgi:hypothetical protein